MCCRTISTARPTRWPAPSTSASRERIGRARRDGLPLASCSSKSIAIGKRDGQGVEPQDVQAHRGQGQRGLDDARRRARRLPRRRRHGRDGALQLQDGDRADRVDLDHLRRHQRPASSRSRPTSTRTRRCRAASRSRTPISRSCSQAKSKDLDQRRGTRSSRRAARSSTSTSSARGKGALQDQLRDRPALAARVRRRPRALHRPGAEPQPVHPGRRRQVGPCDAALPARGRRASSRSITCARSASSAPASPAGSRRTTPPTRR